MGANKWEQLWNQTKKLSNDEIDMWNILPPNYQVSGEREKEKKWSILKVDELTRIIWL